MKRFLTTLAAITAIARFSYSQNTFPTNADAGIGIDYKLKIGYGLALPSYIKPVWNDNSNSGLQIHTFAGGSDIAAMSFSPTTGYVGLGTTAPSENLSIAGGGSVGNLSINPGPLYSGYKFTLTTQAADEGFHMTMGGTKVISTYGYNDADEVGFGNLGHTNLLYLNSGGKVGVGTTTPSGKLEVDDSNGTGVIAYFGANSITNAKGIYLARPIVNTNPVNIQGTQAAVGVANLSMQAEGGNLGVGITTPNSKLDIYSSSIGAALRVGAPATGTSNDASIDLYTNNANNTPAYARLALGVTTASVGSETGYLGFSTINSGSLTEKMRIAADGNIGIGTTDTKGYKLAVNGTIRSKEVKVEASDWPDYVFKSTYKLLTLNEVKTYIDKHQHLPEMPSEKEVKKNGIALGEMVKLQTKKIEELTLYLIDKDKQIKQQEEKIAVLEQQVSNSKQLEIRITALEKASNNK